MSNINVANIVNPTTADSTPTYNLSKQVCKAWVNFDGTGVPTIRDSYNVASITDVGVGQYNIVFGNNMNNTTYVVSVQCALTPAGIQAGGQVRCSSPSLSLPDLKTVSEVGINTGATYGGTNIDFSNVYVQVFGS